MEKVLTVKASRISSLKSIFFPMRYDFYKDDKNNIKVIGTTKNWIGQKTTHKQSISHFRIKGFILRKMTFTATRYYYGRFWAGDCKKVKILFEEYIPETNRLEWSDTWF